jgi:hypothetical protein
LTFTFIGITEETQFRVKIKELAGMNCVNLSEEKLDFLTPLLFEFLCWMRALYIKLQQLSPQNIDPQF